MNYKVGDVVCANYGNFNCEKSIGIFLIIYSERQDRIYSDGHSNFNAIKITTNNFLGDSYTVRIYAGDGNLETNCLANISKVHTLSKEQVYKKLGTLKNSTMFKVFKELRNFNNEMESQIMETI
jgi:mRNA-degrading endonuclease toxin of MazEF toxin-antitoxin module